MTNIINLHDYRDAQLAKKMVSLDEALDYIQLQPGISIEDIARLYALLSAHQHEDFLATVAHNTEISPLRKSMLFQVAHYSDNMGNTDTISLQMILALYFGMKQEETSLEIRRLFQIFITRAPTEEAEWRDTLIMRGFSGAPWKFSGNLRTAIQTTLRSQKHMNSKE